MTPTDYNYDIQKIFLEMILADASTFVRIQNIFNVQNFHPDLREAADLIQKHSDKYGTLPELEQIRALTGTNLEQLDEGFMTQYDWFFEEFEKFTKHYEIERAVVKAADLLDKGDHEPIEQLIKDAVQISLTKDMGTDYFADPKARLKAIKDNNGQLSTGWAQMDDKLYGGFNRGELQICRT